TVVNPRGTHEDGVEVVLVLLEVEPLLINPEHLRKRERRVDARARARQCRTEGDSVEQGAKDRHERKGAHGKGGGATGKEFGWSAKCKCKCDGVRTKGRAQNTPCTCHCESRPFAATLSRVRCGVHDQTARCIPRPRRDADRRRPLLQRSCARACVAGGGG